MRAHSRGNRALAVAFLASLTAFVCVSSGCGAVFSLGSDGGSPDGASDAPGSEAGTNFCEDQSHQSPIPALCDSFDDRQNAQDTVGRWTEVVEGDGSKIALSIDSNASVSRPSSLRIQRVESGSEGAHFLRFEASLEPGQEWHFRGKIGIRYQPVQATGAGIAPLVIRVMSTKVAVAHTYLKFDVSADGKTHTVSALRSGSNPFNPTGTELLQSWAEQVYAFDLGISRASTVSGPVTAVLHFDGSSKEFELSDAPRTLTLPTIRMDLGGYTAAGGWDVHVDDVVITQK